MSAAGPPGWRDVLEFGRTLGERRAARRRKAEESEAEAAQAPAEQATPKPRAGRRVALPTRELLLLVICVGAYELMQLGQAWEVTEERLAIFLVCGGIWVGLFAAAGLVLFWVYRARQYHR